MPNDKTCEKLTLALHMFYDLALTKTTIFSLERLDFSKWRYRHIVGVNIQAIGRDGST